MDRRLHFVGTLPQFADAEEAFRWQHGELAGLLRRISGGETGQRLQWFVPVVKELKRSGAVRVVKDGDWTAYDDTDRLVARRLDPAQIPLHIAEDALAEVELLRAAGTPATAAQPLQVGVPGYLDMALFIFGPLGVFKHARGFLKAAGAQIDQVQAAAGERVVFQLELPLALIAVTAAPPPLRRIMASVLARLVTRQAARAPEGTRFGVHLCFGDLGHRALRRPRSAAPMVALANAIVRHWPAGRALDFVHLPMSGGDEPPPVDAAFYAPLRGLRPGSAVVVAGIAHERQDERAQLTVRDHVEAALGRPVDLATSCGLGRRSPVEAESAVARMRVLL
ncbi:hypothetical protein VSH64_04890 [Amycolatopsis rhabdoformis]|uniref:Cobalamin-independent methionine synthase MetE C-terminal/archaeal domain-containing protein n=1 Tax=Amycolatopsis rhabdoformis TaxID=1448059 RepID=A0ABZ1ID21_9PSEU|nr:hypothetical protein [Amycolatopsis rhabdoformis]WSE31444.1 hypothetical protein VSH64_04890 [Amycolatopsis rhabdoformis]